MTRYARAKGSKASNERIPEPPTSWETMKKDLEISLKEKAEKNKRQEMNKIREENYKKFLEENTETEQITWAEFPTQSKNTSNGKFKLKKQLKRLQKPNKPKIKKSKNSKNSLDDSNKEESTTPENHTVSQEENNNTKPKKKKLQILETKREKQNNKNEKLVHKEPGITETKQTPGDGVKQNSLEEKPLKKPKKKLKALKKLTETLPQSDTLSKNTGNEKISKRKLRKLRRLEKMKNSQSNESMNQENCKLGQNTDKGNVENAVKPKKSRKKKKKQLTNDRKIETNADITVEDNHKVENVEGNNKSINDAKPGQKRKVAKVRDNKIHKRRKEEPSQPEKIMVKDREEEIVKFDGFPVIKTDYLRLVELRKKLKNKGVPQKEIYHFIMGERRRAERFLARLKKTHCFNCRQGGHILSQCPKLSEQTVETTGTGVCFKCGSTEHTSTKCNVRGDSFKFAQCFICKEQGHIARQCPDNPRGLYPEGGACKICGDVTHFKKDCPENQEKGENKVAVVSTISENDLEGLEDDMKIKNTASDELKKKKVVKF